MRRASPCRCCPTPAQDRIWWRARKRDRDREGAQRSSGRSGRAPSGPVRAEFAVLPMLSPDAAAVELTRAVKELGFHGALINGTTEGRFLDHPSYDGILSQAEALDVPIYIHPHLAPEAVRDAYYSDLEPGAGRVLEAAGWGWHSETALHVLRLVLSGALDRHPRLKLIIGHMGEMLPMMLARADDVLRLDIEHLRRPVGQTILESGVDHDERNFQRAAVPRGVADVRDRPGSCFQWTTRTRPTSKAVRSWTGSRFHPPTWRN